MSADGNQNQESSSKGQQKNNSVESEPKKVTYNTRNTEKTKSNQQDINNDARTPTSQKNEVSQTSKVLKFQGQPSSDSNTSKNLRVTSSNEPLSLKGEKDYNDDYLLSESAVSRFSPVWNQSIAASGPILLTFTAGLTSGYSAVLLPQLKAETNGPIHYDDNTGSWIASIAALAMAPGCLISGYLMEKFGRRNSHHIISVPFLLGWIVIACASDLTLMLAGRFLTGICAGLLAPLSSVYIAETSEPRLRGFLLAEVSLAIALGIFVVHLIGTFMSWQWTAIISGLFPILSVLLLMVVPESPSWLVSKGKIERGVKSFCWLRGYDTDAKNELKGIVDSKKALDSEPLLKFKKKLANLKSPELIKPLFIMIFFFMTGQFSGVNVVAFYAKEIVEKAIETGIDPYLVMLLIDALRVGMSMVACVVCRQYGRRPLCMISGICTAISMVGLSMFLHWKPENMAWLPLIFLMIYISAISIGLVPLPWIMCGEVFSLKYRGLGSGISTAMMYTCSFISVKTAPGMMSNFGQVTTFLVYGIIALIGTAILYFILPETKGRSLQEIEEMFRTGNRTNT